MHDNQRQGIEVIPKRLQKAAQYVWPSPFATSLTLRKGWDGRYHWSSAPVSAGADDHGHRKEGAQS